MKDLQERVRRFSKEAGIENPPHIAALDFYIVQNTDE